MNSYRHIVYMILDQVKGNSDDFNFNENHIIYLVNKLRVFFLDKKYANNSSNISEENFQELCINLEPSFDDCNMPLLLKSTKQIPDTIITSPKLYIDPTLDSNLNMINIERFSVAGSGKYSGNSIYATIGKDRFLYIKGKNPQFINLREIRVSGVFADPLKVKDFKCGECEEKKEEDNKSLLTSCDPLDEVFPLEEALLFPIVQVVVQEVFKANTNIEDELNNSNDDIPNKMSILSAMLRNRDNNKNGKQRQGQDYSGLS